MTLQEALDTEFSPDRMGDITPNELADKLIEYGVFENAADMNRLVIEGIQNAVNDDDEFPIRYYNKDEEIPDESRFVDPGPALTDKYIEETFR